MKIDFVIFQLYEYQHFPDFKKNCNVYLFIFNIDVKPVNNINQSIFVEVVLYLQVKDGVYVWMGALVNFIRIQVNI